MSKTVDERIVEMRFDNRNFESNVATSMSTLDKLKQKLNLTGASKNLESLNTAAKKIDFSPVSNSFDNVVTRFSHAQMTIQHQIDRWADKIMMAAERAVKALTVDPVSDGWREYEMTLNAVQTTMAGTGKTAEEVEEQLKRLDKYADKTVYGTADMLNNLPKFTNAGVDLEKATTAMIGIANATAHAGGDAGKASIAFYNLGQAIGTGYLTRIDYNSINNAGIATMEWKEQMVEAAIAQGTLTKVGEDAYKAGNKTLTLQQLFIDGLQEQWATTDVMMKVFSDYGDETTEIGKKAYSSAQDIKTFTMMMESLKATAGTGWKDTWQLIFGGLDEAKEFWTGLSDFISGIIGHMAKMRNGILDKALNNPFADAIKSIMDVNEGIGEAIKSLENYSVIVDEIIGGKWGNGQERWDKLTEAGYDWAHAQNLVNEELGCSVRHATNYTEAQKEVTNAQKKSLEELVKLSDEELRNAGYTYDQVKALRFLEEQSKKTGIPIDDLAKDIDQLSGRSLLINGFKNIAESLVAVFTQVKRAWRDIFFGPGATDEEVIQKRGEQIYNLIAAFHKFTTKLHVNGETATKLRRIFRGLFAAIDLVTTVLGGAFKIAFKVVTGVMEYFNVDALELLAIVGDAIVAFNDWFNSIFDIKGAITWFIPIIQTVIQAVKKLIDVVSNIPIVQKAINGIKNAFDGLKNIDLSYLGQFLVDGFRGGFADGIKKMISAVADFAKKILSTIKDILGIHSPSTEFFDIASWCIKGFVQGILDGIAYVFKGIGKLGGAVIDAFKESGVGEGFSYIFNEIKNLVSKIDFEKVIAIIPIGIAILMIKKLFDLVTSFGDVMGSIAGFFENMSEGFNKALKGYGFKMMAEGVKELAISLAIMTVCIIGLTMVDTDKLLGAVGVILALAIILGALAFAMGQMSKASASFKKGEGLKIDGLTSSLASIGLAILMLAVAIKVMGNLDSDSFKQGMLGLAAVIVGLIVIMAAFKGLGDNKAAESIDKVGKMVFKLSLAMLLLVAFCKLAGKLSDDEMKKGGIFAAAFVVFVATLSAAVNGVSGDIHKVGKMIFKLSISMLLLILVCKLVGKLSLDEMIKGGLFAAAFLVFVGVLVAVTRIGGQDKIAKLGGTLLSVAFSMLLLIGICKLVGKLSLTEMVMGAAFMAVFIGFVWLLTKVTTITNKQKSAKIAGAILAMAVAVAALALVAILLSMMPTEGLIKGVAAVAVLSTFMAGMIATTRGVKEGAMKPILALVAAVVAMAIIVGVFAAMDKTDLAVACIALESLMTVFAILIATSKKANKVKLKNIFSMIAVVTVLSILLAGLAYVASLTGGGSMIAAAVSLSAIMIALSVAMVIMSKTGRISTTVAKNLLPLTLAIAGIGMILGLLAIIAKFSGGGAMIAAAISLSAVMIVLAVTMKMMSKAGRISTTVTKTLVPLMVAIAGIGAIMGVLAIVAKFTGGKAMLTALGSLSGIMIILAIVMKLMSKVGTISKSVTKNLIPMMLAFGAMTLMLSALAAVANLAGNGSLITAAVSLSVLMLAMSACMKIMSTVGTSVGGALKGALGLAALAIPMLAFIGILWLMSNIESATENAKALANLMLAMSIVLGIITICGTFIASALLGVVSLLALAVPMLAFLGIIALMNCIPNAQANIDMLIGMMTSLTAVLVQVALIAPLAIIGVVAILALELAIAAFAVLAIAIGALVTYVPGIADFIATGIPILVQLAGGLGEAIGAFMGGLSDYLPDIGQNLTDFMTNLSGFIEGAKTIDGSVAAGAGWLSAAIIAVSVGEIVAGIADLLTFGSTLPDLGTELSDFMTNATPFIEGLKSIDENAVKAAGSLAGMIIALTVAEVIDGIASFFGMDVNFEDFGAKLVKFGEGVKSFSATITEGSGIDEGAVTAAARCGEMMAGLQKDISLQGGLLGSIIGNKDLGDFGQQLAEFGAGVKAFSDEVSGGIDSGAVDAAANAGSIMAALQQDISAQDGLLQFITGTKDLGDFGQQLKDFGAALMAFSSEVSGGIDENAVKAAADAGTLFSNLQSSLDNSGGLISYFTGDNDLGTFGDNIKTFGKALSKVSEYLDDVDSETIEKAKYCGDLLVELDKAIPKDEWFDGKVTLSEFAEQLDEFGSGLYDLADWCEDIDVSGIDNMTSAVSQLRTMLNNFEYMQGNIQYIGSITDFANAFKALGTYLTELSTSNFSGINTTTIENVSNACNKLVTMVLNLKNIEVGGITKLKEAVDELTQIQLKEAVDNLNVDVSAISEVGTKIMNAVNSGFKTDSNPVKSALGNVISGAALVVDDYVDTYSNKGTALMTNLIKGINSKKEAAKTSVKTLASDAATKADDYYDTFYDAGAYMVDGFVNGISANSYKAVAQAAAMAEAAKKAAEEALGIQSPSKVFYGIGDYTGQGFVNALADYASKSYAAGSNMADSARKGLTNAISKVTDVLSGKTDMQPTIRPVVDLSGVESGSNAINSMLSMGSTIGVSGNVGVVSSLMSKRNQNGANSDIVDAINRLDKHLDNVGNTTYSVNGVTYDDGSNVSNAVEAIVRAARIERRV